MMMMMIMICAEMQGIHVQKSCSLMKWTAHTHTHTHTHTHIHTLALSPSQFLSLLTNTLNTQKKKTFCLSHTLTLDLHGDHRVEWMTVDFALLPVLVEEGGRAGK